MRLPHPRRLRQLALVPGELSPLMLEMGSTHSRPIILSNSLYDNTNRCGMDDSASYI